MNKKDFELNIKNYPFKSWCEKYPDYNVNINNLNVNDSWKDFLNSDRCAQSREFR